MRCFIFKARLIDPRIQIDTFIFGRIRFKLIHEMLNPRLPAAHMGRYLKAAELAASRPCISDIFANQTRSKSYFLILMGACESCIFDFGASETFVNNFAS